MAKIILTLLEDIRFLGEKQFEIVESVRLLLKRTIEPLTEEVKYGGILFTADVQFCGVFAYKEHVSFEFSHGAKLNDSEGFLEGRGKSRRHIKLRNADDLSAKKLVLYLPLALAAARKAV